MSGGDDTQILVAFVTFGGYYSMIDASIHCTSFFKVALFASAGILPHQG